MFALSPRSGIQVSSVYPTYTHIKSQSPVCVCVCVCVCVAKPVAVELWIRLYINNRFFFKVDFLSLTLDCRVKCPRVGLGVKISDILKNHFFFAFIFLLCNQSYLKNRYYSGFTFSL